MITEPVRVVLYLVDWQNKQVKIDETDLKLEGKSPYLQKASWALEKMIFIPPDKKGYKLRAIIVETGTVAEYPEEKDKWLYCPFSYSAGLPDLAMNDIWVEPPKFSPGENVTLRFSAQNIGEADAVGLFTIGLYFDNRLVGTASLNGLAKGKIIQGYKENFVWPADTNFHTVKVVLDMYDTIKESNEMNNELTQAFRASIPPEPTKLPDLTVEEIDAGIFHPGDEVMIVITIRNQGAGDAVGVFRTNLYFDGKLICGHDQNGLAAGSSFSWHCFFNWPNDFDFHTLTAVVDVYNAIKESNENNNSLSVQIRAGEYPIPPGSLKIDF
jgi:subtilase family serine protease